ncbi:MAG: GMC family oxidoreductase [Thermoanaerobaculia bacterium]|nr:GMC family oxidoreductase [Thermoanaerobaculia bacterium]
MADNSWDWDYVIVGSGFGGSVSALRLTEKGYKVLVLEKGRRFLAPDFAKTNWNLKRWMWMPHLGCRGIFKMTYLAHVTALSGVGVGGGSLVYANTLPVPKTPFFEAPSWGHLARWERELAPHYETALRMLGANRTPFVTRPDEVIREVGRQIGREDGYEATNVAVFFGREGKDDRPGDTVPDPYFGGDGPERTACTRCGGCMVGCRHGAKNTLDKNYLYLAEKRGLKIQADTEVTWVKPLAGGGYELTTRELNSPFPAFRRKSKTTARNVIFSGGALGSVKLLLQLKESPDGLPGLSARLGDFVRTNSEVLVGVLTTKDEDLSQGVAIGSILHTDEHSHLEPVRYPKGSGFFRPLMLPFAPGDSIPARFASALARVIRNPVKSLKAFFITEFAKRTMILLYMRTVDGHIKFRLGRSWRTGYLRGLDSQTGEGPAAKAWTPEANDLTERVSKILDGYPLSLLTETLLGIPTTAHILGGCPMGESPEKGVIDHRHRVFGYDGLYVIDGAAMSANPGVNPSLTITALAERAMTFIPPKAS